MQCFLFHTLYASLLLVIRSISLILSTGYQVLLLSTGYQVFLLSTGYQVFYYQLLIKYFHYQLVIKCFDTINWLSSISQSHDQTAPTPTGATQHLLMNQLSISSTLSWLFISITLFFLRCSSMAI